MRQAVLDVGSNTVHMLVVDAYRGAPPLPATSVKEALRLAEHLTLVEPARQEPSSTEKHGEGEHHHAVA